jgi:hypothetical protein
MKKLLGLAIALALLLTGHVAGAQTRSTSTTRIRMVRAQCTTGPCDPFFTFSGGATLIKRAREPKLVTNRKLGRARITTLQRVGVMGPPIPLFLDFQLSGTIFYGNDLNAVCGLANTTVSGPFATGNLQCIVGADGSANCGGTTFFINFVAPECSDVNQVIQDLNIEIYEGGFVGDPTRLIAVGGMNILGKSPDCASGGAGCP